MLNEILEERVVSSRGRRVPRGVKRKMSNYPLRPRHHSQSPGSIYHRHSDRKMNSIAASPDNSLGRMKGLAGSR